MSNELTIIFLENKVKAYKRLARTQQEYIRILGREIDSMAGIAYAHGWESQNIEIGKRLRSKMKKVKKQLKGIENG